MKTALLLIAHGSRQPHANADLEHVAQSIRDLGSYPIVVAAYLELAPPSIAQGGQQCVTAGAQRVIMLPYFLSAGLHVREDLTQARTELARAHPTVEFLLAEPLGRHPSLVAVALERAREAWPDNSVKSTNG
jgi:sirohydrochlorin ferrochelatase